MNLTYNADMYERPSSMADIVGVWEGGTDELTIAPDGRVTGETSNGCPYIGSLSTIDNRYNLSEEGNNGIDYRAESIVLDHGQTAPQGPVPAQR